MSAFMYTIGLVLTMVPPTRCFNSSADSLEAQMSEAVHNRRYSSVPCLPSVPLDC